jgi:thiol-disulfide isomerase/thioredoxin
MLIAFPKAEAEALQDLKPVPDAVFLDLKESTRALSEFQGKVVLINFWGTWSVPCLREIPELVLLSYQLRGRGLEVVGIAIDSGRPEDIRLFMTEHGEVCKKDAEALL